MESNFNSELYPSEEGFSYFVSFPNAPPTPIITDDEYRWETDILKIIDENITELNTQDSYSLIHPSLCSYNKNEKDKCVKKVEYDEEENLEEETEEENLHSSADLENDKPKCHNNNNTDEKENLYPTEKEETDTEDSEIEMLEMMNTMIQVMVRISRDVKSIKKSMEEIKQTRPTNGGLGLFFGIIFSFWFANFLIRGNAFIFDGVSFHII